MAQISQQLLNEIVFFNEKAVTHNFPASKTMTGNTYQNK
ncbi:hypothetical protein TMUPMC115_0794 [Tetragenococcus muriaticus PMC-11-5]|uniref:Uncharacterized protein n=1 Tax=Tetragenococcus muriaticus PMC-11-5 TaxID=1302649 RepID=A0A091C7L3_9ENTE|nr:hypothetical protein TMUPMC115_0794 [Tetragenococcus muriaticus PMC-11-5]